MIIGVVTIETGESRGESYYIADGQNMILGRSSQADIKLPESYQHLSREHCVICFDEVRRRFFVLDTSSGGIFNSQKQRCEKEIYIAEDSRLYLGSSDCCIQFSVVECAQEMGHGRVVEDFYIDSDETISVQKGKELELQKQIIQSHQQTSSLSSVPLHDPVLSDGNDADGKTFINQGERQWGSVSWIKWLVAGVAVIALIGWLIWEGGSSSQRNKSDEPEQQVNASTKEKVNSEEEKDNVKERGTQSGSETGADIKKNDEYKEDNTDDSGIAEDISGMSEDDLKKCIEQYASYPLIGEPIIADFNGDGMDEMVMESGFTSEENGFELWNQIYIYTDGSHTYEFGEATGSTLYVSNVYLIPVDDGFHFATTSSWRSEALAGQFYISGIYGLGNVKAETYYFDEFSQFGRVAEKEIVVYLYQPLGMPDEVDENTLHWNGQDYEWLS